MEVPLKQMSLYRMLGVIARRGDNGLLSSIWIVNEDGVHWQCHCELPGEPEVRAFHTDTGICRECGVGWFDRYQEALEVYRYSEKNAVEDFVIITEERLHAHLMITPRRIN